YRPPRPPASTLSPYTTLFRSNPDPAGRMESTISRRRRRSLSELMRREIPTWSTVGMNTRWRPGSDTYRVVRAPFVLIGSFVTWRSEEHTSELQSPDHPVCRLL